MVAKKTTKRRLKVPSPNKIAKAAERLQKVERADEIINRVYRRIESTWDSSNDCAALLELSKIIKELE